MIVIAQGEFRVLSSSLRLKGAKSEVVGGDMGSDILQDSVS